MLKENVHTGIAKGSVGLSTLIKDVRDVNVEHKSKELV
jgi:hypothetical protein